MRLLALASFCLILAACGPPPAPPVGEAPAEGAAPAAAARYTGSLPCADCPALDWDLTLEPDGAYRLVQTYRETRDGDRTFEQRGRWTTHIGHGDDPAATVYRLDPDADEEPTSLLVLDPDRLEILAQDGSRIDSPFDMTLRRAN
jgi:hypothetical protein